MPFSKSLISALLAIMALAVACSRQSEQTADKSAATPPADSVVITQIAADSMSVLALLEQEHEVDVRGSAMGAFVTGIDSVEVGDGCFWTYKVNDSAIPTACDKYRVGPGDTVVWRFNRGSR